ncbi:uncharacterized protein PFL1_00279 [Pseudozyma flocculosa PF-1]|uniref:Uncharacterized protein n=1 Tax=Pseudozyma flocculosa TaxID=84751 RepID=A0A5C3EV38_9BASI|nr:uncharacterized protein PFL1_00279 [Pseudozyma flocculosa PF-1]EPQ32081.1 hypothetical protein PFL1_00279 [Pseudozyma flocculosa PF-1]SPO34989.1 uncharacterized protein PSFLO_00460 [Pseudozyma flocculosa]
MGLETTFLSPPNAVAPPAYSASDSMSSSSSARFPPTVWSLILSHFLSVYPPHEGGLSASLSDLHRSVRLVNRTLHALTTYVLRAHFLPQYEARVVPPYTSSPLSPREVRVLDHFIAFRITLEMWHFQSSLLVLDDKGVEDDLFRWLQPQTRLEDLLAQHPSASQVWTQTGVDWNDLTVSYRVRNVALLLPFQSGSQLDESKTTEWDTALDDDDDADLHDTTRPAAAVRIIRKAFLEMRIPRSQTLEATAEELLRSLRKYRLVRKVQGDGRPFYEVVGQA